MTRMNEVHVKEAHVEEAQCAEEAFSSIGSPKASGLVCL